MTTPDPPPRPDEFAALQRFSARIGADPLLVQGPGGNTSVKAAGVLWVKASGTLLADAMRADIFLPVSLDPLLDGLTRDDPACETCLDFVPQTLNPRVLRPSIETTMHAVMPQRVVIHVHCVDTIAWAARADAEAVLEELLDGLDWIFVPYARPGMPLTRNILARLRPQSRVLILGNHGLVVAAETTADAAALLADVQSRLRRPVRLPPAADIDRLRRRAAGSAYQPAADDAVHATATDAASLDVASGGSLYPDHVIFLGPGVVIVEDHETIADAVERAARPVLPLILVPSAGALVHEAANASALALARCLADVAARLDPQEPLHRLSEADEDALLNWDAEKYRQSLARARR